MKMVSSYQKKNLNKLLAGITLVFTMGLGGCSTIASVVASSIANQVVNGGSTDHAPVVNANVGKNNASNQGVKNFSAADDVNVNGVQDETLLLSALLILVWKGYKKWLDVQLKKERIRAKMEHEEYEKLKKNAAKNVDADFD